MGDFTGFTFGGVKSSDLGIIRVSGGDRYDEELHPEIKDRTAEVPGLHGEYYFGSDYGPRTFNIDFAFDHLTEEQFRRLRQIFGTKEIRQLIFDERPYKYYMAKIENPIELSYICFDEPNYEWTKIPLQYNEHGYDPTDGTLPIVDTAQVGYSQAWEGDYPVNYMEYAQGISGDFEYKAYDGTTRRIYKGEGRVSFKCYFPFAKSVYKQIPVTEVESDWVVSSGILFSLSGIDTYDNGLITVYNPGDIATGFRLYLPAEVVQTATTITYTNTLFSLELNAMTLKSNDIGVLIDTNNGLITGVSSIGIDQNYNTTYTTSGNLYNSYVNSGTFFHIEPNMFNTYSTLQITGGGNGIKIFYDYLYF